MHSVTLKLTGEVLTVDDCELAVLVHQHLVDPPVANAPAEAEPEDNASEGTPVLRADATDDQPE